MRRFTPAEIEKLKLMASWGHDGKSIGRALDRTPQAIRVKCVELGIALRVPSANCRRVKISPETWEGLCAEAAQLGTSPGRLARQLVEVVVRDRLYAAVIDPPLATRRTTTVKPNPKWSGALATFSGSF